MHFQELVNPPPQLLRDLVESTAAAANVDPSSVPYLRAYREPHGRYVDRLSRLAFAWWRDRPGNALRIRLGVL